MKRTISILMTMLLILAMLPAAALAATEPTAEDLKTPPTISKLEIHDDKEGFVWLEVTVQTPANVLNAIDYYENHELGYNQAGYIGGIELQYSIDGGEWQTSGLTVAGRYYEGAEEVPSWNGIHETWYLDELHVDSEVKARARYTGADADGNIRCSDWSNMLTLNEKVDFQASSWALSDLAEADALGLIPDSLKDKDLTKTITRAEFAAISVKVFEALTFTTIEELEESPFKDTSDPEVLKAYNVGITDGSNSKGDMFSPNALLTREQAATMLTRVWKKVNLSGWCLEDDSKFDEQFKTCYTMPAKFDDDAKIAPWAYDSVYFMAANHIVEGSNGRFNPKALSSAEDAIGYAKREQAIVIALRMVKNL